MNRALLWTAKAALLLLVLLLTNHGLVDRLELLVADRRLVTLVVFCAIWLCALAAVLAAAFHPAWTVRLAWAVPLSLAGAAAFGYHAVQQSEFFIFDVLNLWAARHEAGRALAYFSAAVPPTLAVLCLSLAAFAMPPGAGGRLRGPLRWLFGLAPALPIVLIALVVLHRQGKGSDAMPRQFAPVSLAALAAYKLHAGTFAEREPVRMAPGAPPVRALVVMVDESVRADAVSLAPGNPFTPEMASQRDRWVDFGPAVSAGNCSNISNALLRFMAQRRDLVRSVVTSPTVWQYAKAAGFRTVYIDAQAGFIHSYGRLQNHMTPAEAASIDRLHKLGTGIPTHLLDDELVRIVLDELAQGDRVFIYANKNGAHFPYEKGAPGGQERNVRVAGALVGDDPATLAAYARAVRWSTDRTMARLVREAPWDGLAMVYTSDHGQHFSPGRLTHCSSHTNVDPQEGIVPLMVAAGDEGLRRRFAEVAAQSAGRASHFAIAPTLLELMGYAPADIAAVYEDSLLHGLSPARPQFASDDIFGLFGTQPGWHDVDPRVQQRGIEDGPGEALAMRVRAVVVPDEPAR